MPRALGLLDWAAIREDYLRWWFTVPITDYLRWNLEVPFIVALPFAPLLLGYIVRRRRAAETAVAAIVLAILCQGSSATSSCRCPKDKPESPRYRGTFDARRHRRVLELVAARDTACGAAGSADRRALVVIAIRRSLQPTVKGERIVFALAALQLICINALWLYNDRYYVVFAPLLAIVGAQALDRDRLGRGVAAGLLIAWAGIAISGTRDMLAFNGTCASVAEELEASGIPPWDIDAGYALDGWRLYAHPEHLPPGASRESDVPFVTSNRPTHYSITNSPLPNSEVLRIVPLIHASWQATRVLYVVHRD